jgi:hypothetical protein
MDNMIEKLLQLPLEDIEKIQVNLQTEIQRRQRLKIIQSIKDDVQMYGFTWKEDFKEDVEGLEKYELPFDVQVYSCDKEDYNDVHVGDVSEEQKAWVEELNFDGYFSDDSNFEIVNERWKYRDWDDPCYNIGRIMITVYFMSSKHKPIPKGVSSTKIINKKGDLQILKIKDGNIVVDDVIWDKVENWSNYSLFILPNDDDE